MNFVYGSQGEEDQHLWSDGLIVDDQNCTDHNNQLTVKKAYGQIIRPGREVCEYEMSEKARA